MKEIDVIVAALLVIGGLNWGLVGIYEFDLVASVLGEGSLATRTLYAFVGVSAFYQAVTVHGIRRRWKVAPVRSPGRSPSRVVEG